MLRYIARNWLSPYWSISDASEALAITGRLLAAKESTVALNVVTVTVAVSDSPVDAVSAEGHYVFVPNGTQWPATIGAFPIVPMIQRGTLVLGTSSVQLVASDNFAAYVLSWDVIINVRGIPTINVPALPVLFASGATQSIWDILQANGWIPINQP
jgi:hypothetical protein